MKNLPVEEVTLARMAKLADVNTTDIRDGIRLGCQTMSRTFNAEDNDVPYQRNLAFDDARFVWVPRGDSHVPGRHLNALLRAEAVADITIDENAIEKHKHAAFFSYSGPVRLPLAREKSTIPRFSNPNNHSGPSTLCQTSLPSSPATSTVSIICLIA